MNPKLSKILRVMRDLPDFVGLDLISANQAGAFGNTPLHVAAVWNDVEVAKTLLEAGADINAAGEHGYTPLHEAVEQGNEKFVKFLLDHNADKTIKNIDGLVPFQLADEKMKRVFDASRQ